MVIDLGEDVDRGPGAKLVGDVGGARHRLDQRRGAPLDVKQVIGAEIARQQAFGGNGRGAIDRSHAQPFRPRQEHRAQDVEDADKEREQGHDRARIARRPQPRRQPAPCAPARDRPRAATIRTPLTRRRLRSARRCRRPARATASASASAPATIRSRIASHAQLFRLTHVVLLPILPFVAELFSYTAVCKTSRPVPSQVISSRPRASCWSAWSSRRCTSSWICSGWDAWAPTRLPRWDWRATCRSS